MPMQMVALNAYENGGFKYLYKWLVLNAYESGGFERPCKCGSKRMCKWWL